MCSMFLRIYFLISGYISPLWVFLSVDVVHSIFVNTGPRQLNNIAYYIVYPLMLMETYAGVLELLGTWPQDVYIFLACYSTLYLQNEDPTFLVFNNLRIIIVASGRITLFVMYTMTCSLGENLFPSIQHILYKMPSVLYYRLHCAGPWRKSGWFLLWFFCMQRFQQVKTLSHTVYLLTGLDRFSLWG